MIFSIGNYGTLTTDCWLCGGHMDYYARVREELRRQGNVHREIYPCRFRIMPGVATSETEESFFRRKINVEMSNLIAQLQRCNAEKGGLKDGKGVDSGISASTIRKEDLWLET